MALRAHHEALLRNAVDYTRRGWPVFLLGRSKRPVANCPHCPTKGEGSAHDPDTCGCLTCHGFYAATLDPDRIEAMIERVPRGLLAIRTGRASGLLVVDIDPAHGGTIDPDLMNPTRVVASG
ncbi:MAG: bifunctional DNA primase/polymerase, partial [Micromonosporaceae bacterium]|nr:bifunctional DNA primase/polymerase [Micromonosporaceae bacterium]